jgi:hypothetical protein
MDRGRARHENGSADDAGAAMMAMSASSISCRTRQQNRQQEHHRHPAAYPCTLYPLHPSDTQAIMRVPSDALSSVDRLIVAASSLFIVGSVAWVPVLCRWAYRQVQSEPDPDRRKKYAAIFVMAAVLAIAGPHRSPAFGEWIGVRRWRIWESWMRFIAMEVILDQPSRRRAASREHDASTTNSSSSGNQRSPPIDVTQDRLMYAFVPHGIFPFAFAFGVFPEAAQRMFGKFRPVVATATEFFPVVRDILRWCRCVYV